MFCIKYLDNWVVPKKEGILGVLEFAISIWNTNLHFSIWDQMHFMTFWSVSVLVCTWINFEIMQILRI